MLAKGTVTVAISSSGGVATNNADKEVIFENCASFINSISRISNTQVDEAHDINVVIPMHNLIE